MLDPSHPHKMHKVLEPFEDIKKKSRALAWSQQLEFGNVLKTEPVF